MMQYIEYRQLSHIRPGFSETIYADLGVWDLHALRLAYPVCSGMPGNDECRICLRFVSTEKGS